MNEVSEALSAAIQACGADERSSPIEIVRTRRNCLAALTVLGINAALAERGLVRRRATIKDAVEDLSEIMGQCWLLRAANKALEAHIEIDRIASTVARWAAVAPRIGDVYEHMTRLEIRRSPEGLVALGKNDHRARSAYYTPGDLANASCSVISLSSRSRVADLSCGTGGFLVATLPTVSDPFLLHGIDVDPLAVDIARLEIAAAFGDLSIARLLEENFDVGNPLLAPSGTDREQRSQLFDDGFIYAEQGVQTPLVDVVVGNPPWQRIRLEERRFFNSFAPEVVLSTAKDARALAIDELRQSEPALFEYYSRHLSAIARARKQIVSDGRFGTTAKGELNTYSLFAELALSVAPNVALLVKSALFTTRANAPFLHRILDERRLQAIYDFVNEARVFDIDSRERFSLMVVGPPTEPYSLRFASGLRSPDDLNKCQPVVLSTEELWHLNRLTGVLPNTSHQQDLQMMMSISDRNEPFDSEFPEAQFGRLVHLTAHAKHIYRAPSRSRDGVFEGKFLEQYDARFSTFAGVPARDRYTAKARARRSTDAERTDPNFQPEPRFYIDLHFWQSLTRSHNATWSLMWRNTTSATNRRTVLATVVPHLPATQSVQFLQLGNGNERKLALLLSIMNSAVFDFLVRQRLNGIDITSTVIRQIPVPSSDGWKKEVYEDVGVSVELSDFVVKRVACLLSSDSRLQPFTATIDPGVLGEWTGPRRRWQLDIDAAVAVAYGLSEAEIGRILSTLARDYTRADHLAVVERWRELSQ